MSTLPTIDKHANYQQTAKMLFTEDKLSNSMQ